MPSGLHFGGGGTVLRDYLRNGVRLVRERRNDRKIRDVVAGADALLISYPKCGRTWLRFALSNYFSDALQLGIEPDLRSTFSIIPNLDNDPIRGVPGFRFAGQRPGLPLILVSHRPFRAKLMQRAPIIFLVRDPRDIVVSAYFHATGHKQRFAGDIDEFIEDERQGLGSVISYLNAWAARLAHHRHHVTSYERISADLASELRLVLSFLGVPIDEQALRHAVKKSSFTEMQSKERQTGIPGQHYDTTDSESLRMRKGKAGGYVDYLSPAQAERILARCRDELTMPARSLLAEFTTDPVRVAD